jgi:hypothetical protein
MDNGQKSIIKELVRTGQSPKEGRKKAGEGSGETEKGTCRGV